jgi:hypothetical protein
LVLISAIKKHKKSIGKDNLTIFDLLIWNLINYKAVTKVTVFVL